MLIITALAYLMFLSYNPGSVEQTVQKILHKNRADQDKGRYGVHMDEMAELIDDEDYFDAGISGGEPPIAEFLKGHVPVVEIQLDEDRNLQANTSRKANRQGRDDYIEQEVEGEDEEFNEDNEPQRGLKKNRKGAEVSAPPNDQGTLQVNQAAYNMFRPGYTIVIYGPRRSGKSKLMRNICQRMRHFFPEVVVFTMTKSSGEYFGYIPYARVIEGLDEDILEQLIEHQMKLKEARSRGEDVGNTNLLIIIDDCMAEGLRYKKTFNQLFYNGRHCDITLMVAVQDVRGIAPSATINADIACSFSLPDHRGRDTVREKFVDYLSRDEFDALYDNPVVNQKYQVVFFDVAHRYNPLDKRISIGTVDEAAEEPFIMGDKKMWDTEEGREQLQDLGFGYLLDLDDWGIMKPRHASSKRDAPRFAKTKNAASKK